MQNPFDVIIEKLIGLETKLAESTPPLPVMNTAEIINRDELCKRLTLTEPTVIRWERKGKIPCFRIGSNVRYNWPKVIDALEAKPNSKGGNSK